MMRLIVSVASRVCSVLITRWPVSAAVSAVSIVSKSRISPTRITSGSWRSARAQRGREALRVDADLALIHDRAAVADQELDRILDRHDVLVRCALMWSIIAASVVDLPEPVVPVHEDQAALLRAIFSITGGQVRSRCSDPRTG